MRATIKADGTLVIQVETELEAYALMRWHDDNVQDQDRCPNSCKSFEKVILDYNFPKVKDDPRS